jgi:sugar lactone lactonase YvrE
MTYPSLPRLPLTVTLGIAMLAGCRADIRPPDPSGRVPPVRDAYVPVDWPPPIDDPPGPVTAGQDAGTDGAYGIPPSDAIVRRDAGPPAAPGPPCGSEKPDITGIANVDGLAIGPDGTIYFTRLGEEQAWVGRLRPGGGPPRPYWANIPETGGERLWGLALDSLRNRLYVASGDSQAIYRIDVASDPPQVQLLLGGVEVPSDLAVDRDGDIYFSERGDGKIHRVTPDGARNEVTPEPVGNQNSPGALVFGPDGALYVGTFNGPVVRLELADGVERNRSPWGGFEGRANGMAFDGRGRLYVGTYVTGGGDAQLVRVDGADADAVVVQEGVQFSSLAFGRGALDCKDLYIAMPAGPMLRLETDTPGATETVARPATAPRR